MNVYKYLIEHREVANILIRSGLMPSRYSYCLKIYISYSEHFELNGKKSSAVNYCAAYYKVSKKTVYKIINEMQEEIWK